MLPDRKKGEAGGIEKKKRQSGEREGNEEVSHENLTKSRLGNGFRSPPSQCVVRGAIKRDGKYVRE